MEILDRLGVVHTLCFGSETGDTDALVRAAEAMCSPEFTQALRTALDEGRSYPAARQLALERVSGDGALLTAPNDILAAEYCKALLERGSRMRPLAVRRDGGYHDETPDAENPSATAVRAQLEQGGTWRQLVPQTAAAVYADAARYSMRAGERAVLARLRGLTREEWARVPFGSEGLWSKVWRAAQTEASVEAILCAAKSKRYPRTRLQRLLLCAYLGIDAQTLLREAPYVRVLAFDEKAGRCSAKCAETARSRSSTPESAARTRNISRWNAAAPRFTGCFRKIRRRQTACRKRKSGFSREKTKKWLAKRKRI